MHGELEILNVKDSLKYQIMPGEFLVLGRSHSADIVLANDPTMSRLHCKIFYQEKRFWILNLKSSNHTLLNDRLVKDQSPLKDGDVLQVGYYKIRFNLIKVSQEIVEFEPFSAAKRSDKLISKIAIKLGLLTHERLKSAMKKQSEIASDGPYYSLEDIFISEGYLTEQAFAQVQNYQKNIPVQIPNYKLLELIGMGGMGHIYMARCLKTKKIVACKVFVTSAKGFEAQLKEQFLREATALMEFKHKNIVSGIESGTTNGIPYIIMEYVDGPTLQQHIKDRGGRLLADESLQIVIQVVQALDHAYQNGKIHRDIKPENVLLTQDVTAKLCDFGLVKNTNSGESEENVFGTVAYMSPEQIRGSSNIDIRSDIYSLGSVFYRMVFGKLPFVGDSKKIRMQHLEENVKFPDESGYKHKHDIIHVIRKMMAKKPEERYQTPQDLLEDLNKIKRKLAQLDDLQATEELPRNIPLQSQDDFGKKIVETRELINPAKKNANTQKLPHFDPTRELANPNYKRTSGTEERRIPNASSRKIHSQKAMLVGIIAVVAVMLVSTLSIIVLNILQSESKDWAKFVQATQSLNLTEVEQKAQYFLQRYPQSQHVQELQELWQNTIWQVVYTTKKEPSQQLEYATPLCQQLIQINPSSNLARQAKNLLTNLQEDDRKRKELEALQGKLSEFKQYVVSGQLDPGKKIWNDYQGRWLSHPDLRMSAIPIHQQLQEKILQKRIESWKYYPISQLSEQAKPILSEFPKRIIENLTPSDYWEALILTNRALLQPALKNGGYMIAANSQYCHCVWVNDGRVIWTTNLSGHGEYRWVWLNAKDEMIQDSRTANKVVISRIGGTQIKIFTIASGKMLSQIVLPSPILNNCLFYREQIFVNCQNAYTYHISPKNAQILGAWSTEEIIQQTPLIQGNDLVVRGEEYTYYFNLSTNILSKYIPSVENPVIEENRLADRNVLGNVSSKIRFPGKINSSWQIAGDYQGFTSIEEQEIFCHVFKQKNLVWQRRIHTPITQLVTLNKEKKVWLSLGDGGLVQATPNTKTLEPTLKLIKGSEYEHVSSQLLYVPQDSLGKVAIIQATGSKLMTANGDFVKDWGLKENLNGINLGLSQIQGKFLLIPQHNLVKCFSLVSGRKTTDISHVQKLTMPLSIQNLTLWTGEHGGNLQAWNAILQSNGVMWQKSWLAKTIGNVSVQPAVTSKAIYVADDAGTLYSLQLKTGQQNWTNSFQSPPAVAPIASETVIYIADRNGNCYAFEATTGKIKWQKSLGSVPIKEILLGKNKIYLATQSGEVLAVRHQSGEIAWRFTILGNTVSAFGFLDSKIYVATDLGWLSVIREN